jgi:hypothetical protein
VAIENGLETFVRPQLEPGERIECMLHLAHGANTKIGHQLRHLGPIGKLINSNATRRANRFFNYRAVVLTDLNVYLLDVSEQGEPQGVVGRTRRGNVVASYGKHALTLQGGDMATARLRVDGPHDAEASALARALGAAAH